MINPDGEQQQHLRELLEIHTRNARSLEKQIAQFGIEPPLKLINSLDFEQREVQALEHALSALVQAPHARLAAPAPTRHSVRMVQRPPHQRLRAAMRQAGRLSRRWWATGGVGMLLIAALLGFAMLRPAPNPALIDEIRAAQPGTRSITMRLTTAQATPPQFDVNAGDVVALFVINDTDQPRRVVLVDGTLATATSALGAPIAPGDHSALLAPGERSAFPFVAAAGRSYTCASAPPGAVVPTDWATIVVRSRAGGA